MAHHDQDQLPSIDLESLDMITGGVTTRSSSTNDPNGQLTTALQSITSSIASLKNNNNQVMRLVIDSNPGWARGKALLAASEAQVGNIEHAKRLMAEYVAGDPGITIRAFSDERSSVPLAAVSPIYRR